LAGIYYAALTVSAHGTCCMCNGMTGVDTLWLAINYYICLAGTEKVPLLLAITIYYISQGWGQLHMNVIKNNYMKICQLQL